MTRRATSTVNIALFLILQGLLGASSPTVVSFVRMDSGYWSIDGREFVVAESWSLSEFNGKLKVMVSFKPGSKFGESLQQKKSLIAYYSSMASGVGRALVSLNSSEEVDQLALLAHQDIGLCGAIERFNPALTNISLSDAASPAIASSIKSQAVSELLSSVTAANLQSTVEALENLGTRHHSAGSSDASSFVESLWQPLLPSGASITKVSHTGYTQKSVLLKIPGTDTAGKTIIIGAHLDSINPTNNQNAPGADDDASGIAALTEVLRIIKTSGATFARPIELHAYAAEEVGLIGSQGVVAAALSTNQNVAAMLQLDMIGYSADPNEQIIHVITTDTSPVLARHLKDLTSNYLGAAWQASELASGTSDHRSWHKSGFHAAFAFENPLNYNRALHTEADQSSRLNFDFAARFTKLTVAFLAHEAGLNTAVSSAEATWAAQQMTASFVKLAVSRSKAGGYRISAAVPKSLNAQTGELCRVSQGDERGCQSLVTSTTLAKDQFDKTFFVSKEDLALAQGDLWRFHLYNAVGGLVAIRTVKLRDN
jgi:hypothetical protein